MNFLVALILTVTSLVWGFLTVKYMDDPKSVHEDVIKVALILLTVVYIGLAITVVL